MNHVANHVIDRLHGTNAVARIFEIKPSSVSEWRVNGIPKARLQFLRLAHPEAFNGLERVPATSKRKSKERKSA